MALAMRTSASPALGTCRLPLRVPLGARLPRAVCQAQRKEVVRDVEDEPRSLRERLAMPLAGMVAAAMLAGAFVPDEAMAARSGGRVGGGGFGGGRSSMRSAAPSRVAPGPSSSLRSYGGGYAAPPVVVAPGYGYGSPFGFGGFGFSPFSILPIGFGFGGIFQFFFLMAAISVAFNVISGVASRVSQGNDTSDNIKSKGGSKDKDGDGWGDL